MSEVDVECTAENHEYGSITEPYYKMKRGADWVDWLFGTEMDRTRNYARLSCTFCGDTKEVVCEDHSPATNITVIHVDKDPEPKEPEKEE